jgi:hypothetical protein
VPISSLPRVRGGGGSLQGLENPCVFSRFGHQSPDIPLLPLQVEKGARGDAHNGRCFGTPLCAISRFSHQDAQTPPSPLVGEGG